MRYSEAIRAVKERLNIVDIVSRYVQLRRNGSRHVAPCPFHDETKPSFSVNEEEGLFYCFGCHASGDVFDFYSRINGTSFIETLEQLAQEAGVELEGRERDRQEAAPRRRLLAMHEEAARHFSANLAGASGASARQYLGTRGVSQEMAQSFGLGYALPGWQNLIRVLKRAGFDDALAAQAGLCGISAQGRSYDRFRGRLIFPIRNLSGQVIAFGGRILPGEEEEQAKYINSQETPIYTKGDHLFGLGRARRGIQSRGSALLTEGYMDVLTLHQYGFENAAGVLGTALTPRQAKRLSGFCSRIELVFDGDSAGRKAAFRSAEMLLAMGLTVTVVALPDGEDIDSFLRGSGPKAFEQLCAQARDGLNFCLDVLQAGAPRDAVAWTREFMGRIEIPELRAPLGDTICRALGLDRRALDASPMHQAPARPAASASSVLANLTMRERQILIFVARYPEMAPEIRRLGADLALNADGCRDFFEKVARLGPDEAPGQMDENWRAFWFSQRAPDQPPRNNAERELEALRLGLEKFHAGSQNSSFLAALRSNAGSGDFQTDLDYLRALKATLEQGK